MGFGAERAGAARRGTRDSSAGPMEGSRGRRTAEERTDRYVIVLMVRAGADLARACEIWEATCGAAVHEGCFQRDGTMHFTLSDVQWLTEREAAQAFFRHPPPLPIDIRLAGLNSWSSCLAAKADIRSARRISSLLADLAGLPRKVTATPPDSLHLSVYRRRGMPRRPFEDAVAQMKAATCGLDLGHVVGTAIAIKVVGCPYTEDCGQYRLLAAPVEDTSPA